MKLPVLGALYQAAFESNSESTYASLTTPTEQLTADGDVLTNPRGIVMYKPRPNEFNLTKYTEFEYAFRDAATGIQSDTATVKVLVASVNDAPEGIPNTAVCPAGGEVVIALEATDVDEDSSNPTAFDPSGYDDPFAYVSAFPSQGSLFQVDEAGNATTSIHANEAQTSAFAWASEVIRYSSQFSLCGSACFTWAASGCDAHSPMTSSSVATPQWSDLVEYWGTGNCRETAWHANQILGEPSTFPEYTDSKTSWSLSHENFGHEWIELRMSSPMYITKIEYYETFKPGALYRVSTTENYQDDNTVACDGHIAGDCSTETSWDILYTGKAMPTGQEEASISSPPFCSVAFASEYLRIDLDTASVPGWNNADAVAIYGTSALPTGLVKPSAANLSNRVLYVPDVGTHGADYFEFKMTDCSDLSDNAARVMLAVEPPTEAFLEAYAYTVIADHAHTSGRDATLVSVDLSAVYAKLGDVEALVEIWANEFDSVSLSSRSSSVLSLVGDTIRVNLTSSDASLDLDVVSNEQSRKVIVGSESAPTTRLELWVKDSAKPANLTTTFRIILAHCPFGFMVLLSSGLRTERHSCMSCVSIEAKIEAGTLLLSEVDTRNVKKTCSPTARSAFQCAAGEYFNSSELFCRPCGQGTFAEGTGIRTACTLCPKAEFAPQGSMSACLPCEYGSFSEVEGAAECHACPNGATCDASSLTVNRGRWRSAAQPYELYECPITEACLGGSGHDAALCSTGFVGPLCSHCASGYFLSWSGKTCENCGKAKNHGPTIGVAVVLGVIITGFVVANRNRLKSSATFTFLQQMRSAGKVKFKCIFFALQV